MRKILFIFIILSFTVSASAEIITLKSGKIIEGKILEKTDQYIKVDVGGIPLYYELKYIASVGGYKPPVTTGKDVGPYFKKGLEYASEAKFKEAKEEFKNGLAIKPSDHNLGELLKVIEGLESGTINEEYAVYLFRGTNYLVYAQYQQAITEFQLALKLKPDDSDLYYYLGICNYKLGRYQLALDNFGKVLGLGTNDEIYYYLGLCYYSLSQYQQAITNLEKAIQIDPYDAEAYSLIGTSNYFLSNIELAKANLLKAKELFQKKGDYLNSGDIEEFLDKLK